MAKSNLQLFAEEQGIATSEQVSPLAEFAQEQGIDTTSAISPLAQFAAEQQISPASQGASPVMPEFLSNTQGVPRNIVEFGRGPTVPSQPSSLFLPPVAPPSDKDFLAQRANQVFNSVVKAEEPFTAGQRIANVLERIQSQAKALPNTLVRKLNIDRLAALQSDIDASLSESVADTAQFLFPTRGGERRPINDFILKKVVLPLRADAERSRKQEQRGLARAEEQSNILGIPVPDIPDITPGAPTNADELVGDITFGLGKFGALLLATGKVSPGLLKFGTLAGAEHAFVAKAAHTTGMVFFALDQTTEGSNITSGINAYGDGFVLGYVSEGIVREGARGINKIRKIASDQFAKRVKIGPGGRPIKKVRIKISEAKIIKDKITEQAVAKGKAIESGQLARRTPPTGIVTRQPSAPSATQAPLVALEQLGNAQVQVINAVKRHGSGGITEAEQHPNLVAARRVKEAKANQLYDSLNPKHKIGSEVTHNSRKVKITQAFFDVSQSADALAKTGFPSTFKFQKLKAVDVKTGESVTIFSNDTVNGELLRNTIKTDVAGVLDDFIKGAQPAAALSPTTTPPIQPIQPVETGQPVIPTPQTTSLAPEAIDPGATVAAKEVASPLAQVNSQIVRDNSPLKRILQQPVTAAKGIWQLALRNFINRYQPLWNAQATMSDNAPLADIPAEVRFAQAAKVLNMTAPSKARQWVLTGTSDVSGNITGPGISQIIQPIAADVQTKQGWANFEAFRYSLHSLDVIAAGKNPGISQKNAQAVVDQFKDKPGWLAAAEGMTQWHTRLLDYVVDSGGLSAEAKAQMQAMYPHYVPLQRAMEGKLIRAGVGGKKLGNLPLPIKRLKGSELPIISPMISSVAYAERLIALGDKIRIGTMLVDAAEHFGGMDAIVKKIPSTARPVTREIQSIKKQLELNGVDLGDADLEATITVFENMFRGSNKDNIITLFRDGKRELFQLEPDLFQAFTGIDKQFQLPKIFDWVLGVPARAVRLGATGIRAGFGLVTNPLRDVQTATMQTRAKGLRGQLPSVVARSIGGVVNDITGGEAARLFKAGGGELAQPLGIDRRFTKNILGEVLAVSPQRKVLNWAKHPVESLRRLFSVPELGPRIGEFTEALKETGWKPGQKISFKQYMDAQMRAANVSVDFREGGWLSMWINRIVPFHNSSLQGPNRMVQAIRNDPAGSTMKALIWLFMPKLAEWWRHKDEDWYKELPDWEKWRYYHIRIGDNVLRIPTPFEWALIFGSIPVAYIESIYNQSTQPIKDAIGQTIESLIPPLMPAVAKPVIDVVANKDFFRGSPIVPLAEQRLEPADRFNRYTTETAKAIGRIFNISPRNIDHITSGYTGGLGLDALKNIEKLTSSTKSRRPPEARDIPVIGRLFLRQTATRVFEDFYKERNRLNQQLASARKFRRQVPEKDLGKANRFNIIARSLTAGRKAAEAIIVNPDLSVEEKRRQLLENHNFMRKLAKQALK